MSTVNKATNKNKILAKSIAMGLIALIPLMIGHGCGVDFEIRDEHKQSNLGSSRQLNTDFEPLANTRTASLTYSKQVLDNMVACLGLEKASASTEREWNERKGNLSEFGFATELTSPMLMAVVAIAGEACSDLIEKERSIGLMDRRIFKEADFANNASVLTNTDLEKITRRLSRSCWQREPSSTEVSQIVDAVEASVRGASQGGQANHQGALMACTAVLSSLEAVQL